MSDLIVARKRPSNKPFADGGDHAARTVTGSPRRCPGPLGEATTDTGHVLFQSDHGDGHQVRRFALGSLALVKLSRSAATLTSDANAVVTAGDVASRLGTTARFLGRQSSHSGDTGRWYAGRQSNSSASTNFPKANKEQLK